MVISNEIMKALLIVGQEIPGLQSLVGPMEKALATVTEHGGGMTTLTEQVFRQVVREAATKEPQGIPVKHMHVWGLLRSGCRNAEHMFCVLTDAFELAATEGSRRLTVEHVQQVLEAEKNR